MKEEEKEEIVLTYIENDTFIDYKDVLLFNKTIENHHVTAKLSYSRFKIILSNYLTLNNINIQGVEHADKYNDYTISEIDERGNIFKFIKVCDKATESLTPHNKCNCGRSKLMDHESCYYCQRVNKNYTTKI